MATHTITAGDVAKHGIVLAAGAVDTVTFTDNAGSIQIISDGTAAVYYTLDGSTPTIAGANTYMIPAAISVDERTLPPFSVSVVKLISAGTPTLSVQRG